MTLESMAFEECIKEQTYTIKCRGRSIGGKPILHTPIDVKIKIYQFPERIDVISSDVSCPYNTGGNGQICKASYRNVDKDKDDNLIGCPYSFDIPYAIDNLFSNLTKKISP